MSKLRKRLVNDYFDFHNCYNIDYIEEAEAVEFRIKGDVHLPPREYLQAFLNLKNDHPIKQSVIQHHDGYMEHFGYIIAILDNQRDIIRITKTQCGIHKDFLMDFVKAYPNHRMSCYRVPYDSTIAILSHLLVRLNPIKIHHSNFSYNESVYRNISTVKNVYQNVCNETEIYDICKRYGLSMHNLNNKVTVVNREYFDRAIKLHTRIDFINPTETIKTLLI